MANIIIYNKKKENHQSEKNYFYIGRGSCVGNPFTHIKNKETLAEYIVENREKAIEKYEKLLPTLYEENKEVKEFIDNLVELYNKDEDIFLECYCKPLSCHGDVIKSFVIKKNLKNKLKINNPNS